VDRLSREAKEPDWLSSMRREALALHEQLPWPSSSDDIWRRTDAALLNPRNGFAPAEANGMLKRLPLSDEQAATLIQPMGDETVLVHADGEWISRDAPAGVTLSELSQLPRPQAERLRQTLAGEGLTPEERKFTTLNTAFHRQGLIIDIADGFQSEAPMRLVRLASARPNTAVFPLTVVRVGKGARVTLIQEDVGLAIGDAGAQVITGRIELVLEPEAEVQYCRVQRWQPQAREFLLQRATLQAGAKLTMTNINFGAALSKTHVIAKLQGSGAESRVFGFVFGHHQQHVDFHSLQDHQAPHTMSDLSYKAALKDDSRMIYTGLIRIAKAAKQTDAYQSNHNLLLSRTAKAETIPMLEILADDVRCKHGATVGPVDEEQLFYLMVRAIPRELAERLLVMGFVEPIIGEVPFEPLQQRLRQELEESLV
jgi:Fe-S cluster assembly protein SufD